MKRKKLGVVAFACAAATILAGGVLSNSPFVNPIETKAAAAPVYTLDTTGSLQGSNNSFARNCDITSGGVTWNVTGNTKMNPWRVGGKNLSATDREVYTKTAFAKSVSEVKLTVGKADSITVNSLKLVVASDKDFSKDVYTVPATFAASSTISFVPESGSWSNAFYKFVFNVSVSGSSNKFVEFSKVEFYEAAATGVLTSLSYSGSPALQKTGEAFNAEGLVFSANYDDGDARDVTSEVTFNPATISSDTTVVKATYETVSCDIPVKVKGDLTSISVSGTPATQYIGDAFNPTGLTFTAHYGELSETIEAKDITFAPEAIEAGTKIVVATYKEKTVDITGFAVQEKTAYRFESDDDGAFSGWSNSYGEHVLTYGSKVEVTFSSASKQTSTITDCPVSKAQTATFEALNGSFLLLKVNFKQWRSNGQSIKISVNGTQVGGVHAFPDDGTSVTWTAGEGEAVKTIVIETTNTKNQIGWESLEFKLDPVVKESYAAKFLADTASDCAAGNVTAETWAALETAFNALPEEEKATYKAAVADDTEMGQAIARYDFIIGKYAALNDFMGRGTGTSGLSNLRMSINNQTSMIALISAFSLGLVAAGAYFISKKRKSVR